MCILTNQIKVSLFFLIVAIELSVSDISLKPCYVQFDGTNSFALLTIPKPDDVNKSIRLIVTLRLPVRLETKYDAQVTFVTITNDDLVYRLNFPRSLPLPRPTNFTVNGRRVCSEPQMTLKLSETEVRISHVKILEASSNAGPTPTSLNLSSNNLNFNDIQNGAVRDEKPEKIIKNFGHDFNPMPPDANCGRAITGNLTFRRIANGDIIERGAFPWLAAIFVKNDNNNLRYKCVASLISQKHVLTAGHCVKYMDQPVIEVSKVVVFLGKHSLFQDNENGSLKMEIKHIYLHPEHKSLGYMSDSDLAVLEFETAIEFNDLIRPICLWSGPSDHLRDIVGDYGTVVGWEIEEKMLRQEPRVLRIPIVSQEDCLWSNEEFVHFTSNRTFCAGIRDGKSGPCQGDSGGGLMLFRDYRWMLRGVASLSLKGAASCDLSNYAVFVDVAQYKAWFDQFLMCK